MGLLAPSLCHWGLGSKCRGGQRQPDALVEAAWLSHAYIPSSLDILAVGVNASFWEGGAKASVRGVSRALIATQRQRQPSKAVLLDSKPVFRKEDEAESSWGLTCTLRSSQRSGRERVTQVKQTTKPLVILIPCPAPHLIPLNGAGRGEAGPSLPGSFWHTCGAGLVWGLRAASGMQSECLIDSSRPPGDFCGGCSAI